MTQNKINLLRNQIDSIDQKILKLLSLRGKKVTSIGKTKQKLNANFHVPERERKIFAALKQQNQGPFSDEAIETIFREILSASLALESPLKVAYFGPEATFTHMAAIKRFGLSAQFDPQVSIPEVFQVVFLNKANYGVVPIENSTAGIVSPTLDLFVEYPLKICGEIKIPIAHHLLSKKNDLSSVKKVYSHPHAFPQCRIWLEHHLPSVKTIEVASTAKAAEMASEEEGTAAIASEYAATRYGLYKVATHIEDHPNNFTRFVVIGNQESGISGNDKTSVMFSTKDEVGILYRLLTPIAKAKINLTKIESRPLKGRAWEYMFFIDLDGHQKDPKVKKVLNEMEKHCSFLKVLGSYPKGS